MCTTTFMVGKPPAEDYQPAESEDHYIASGHGHTWFPLFEEGSAEQRLLLEPGIGIEPMTTSLQEKRSTD